MSLYPKLSAIAACSQNGVIGLKGGLPWHISSDLQFFKKTTMGKPILMGRVTWEGLKFPLPGRANLVLTTNPNYISPPAEIFNSVETLLARGFEVAGETGVDEVIVGGGSKLYTMLMPHCDRLYSTEAHADIEGDAYFPKIDPDLWTETENKFVKAGPKDDFDYTIRIYDRLAG